MKSQSDLGAGLLLIGLALVGVLGTLELRFGSLNSVGPALMPRAVSVLVGLFGLGLVVTSFFTAGPRLERWHLRGPIFVLGGALLFGLTIRGSTISLFGFNLDIPQLGLAIAGPITVIVSAFADRETRILEVVIFGIALTAFCVVLFKYLLGLPIPILPAGYYL